MHKKIMNIIWKVVFALFICSLTIGTAVIVVNARSILPMAGVVVNRNFITWMAVFCVMAVTVIITITWNIAVWYMNKKHESIIEARANELTRGELGRLRDKVVWLEKDVRNKNTKISVLRAQKRGMFQIVHDARDREIEKLQKEAWEDWG